MTMSPDNYDEDIEDWKAAFMTAGAALDEIDRISDIDNNDMETSVNKDEMDKILTIKKLVRFYMDVTLDNLTDIIPKVIIEFMSPLEKLKREETRKIYDATKEALKHINEIVSNTRQTNIPPPLQIKEDKKNKHKKVK
ncbi:hypothetical protein A3Q56_01123 [Intoshia linei]|uniref:Uncharacterized protein n=1 Tax=Intoshia linei TaxID=1819745 RepID=A0A177B9V4_9BILA|nr:hypothetical protein A3Q56_01123 [Intoshia linei]